MKYLKVHFKLRYLTKLFNKTLNPLFKMFNFVQDLYIDHVSTSNSVGTYKTISIKSCESCGEEISNYIIHEDGKICPKCGVQHISVENKLIYPNTERNTKTVFLKRLKYFQCIGTPRSKFPPNMEIVLDDYFKSIDHPSRKDILLIPKDSLGRRTSDKVNISNMYLALKECKYSKFYSNIQFILHIYWDWDIPNLKDIEDDVKDKYDVVKSAMKKLNISAKISNSILLWWIVYVCGKKYSPHDFKLIKTIETLNKQKNIITTVSNHLKWEIPS